jgi:8-oxo-dGTP pyrophosphatase MutT (NUDIX family)
MPEIVTGRVPEPCPSSTVMLIRDAEVTPQVLMLKRNANSTFGAVHVFPGGIVDACDAMVEDCCGTVSAAAAADMLGETRALPFYSAAVREVFEETGVLLAKSAQPAGEQGVPQKAALAADRRRLLNGDKSWDRFLRERQLVLDSDRLHYFAHWVTPKSEPRRYSTRFFLAPLPAGQLASHDGGELTDSCWMTAQEVLEAQRAGRMRLIYPTYRALRDIASLRSVDAIVDWAADRQRSGVARVLPAIVEIDGREKVVMPGDPRYPNEGAA